MKKHFLFIILPLLYTAIQAQSTDSLKYRGKSQAVAVGFYLPADVSARTHVAGAGIDYSWSRHRFGMNTNKDKRLGFIANGGATYYIGKSVTTAGYSFRYRNYLNLHAAAGVVYNPLTKGNIALTAGPAIRINENNTRAAIAVNLFGNYYLSEHITIGPGLVARKSSGVGAVWAGAIRASYAF